ncbi:2,3-butanediol dehydrogenase [Fredinandcohnia quinoae]|uniref:2,3-butanediol dehydrogenase n=1 Tax=Fredinandcohnia quinoae TaxID=2918902 RepID=A0AAW5E2T3_9BACI|nr:2,3-butanediol dehydrogenase [Fredinandcohnia sp. SECRCQ15]MCH1624187.1 2,3-butanediol dehydrogenase [Fredinandcohnia sp. SECRCQ15]
MKVVKFYNKKDVRLEDVDVKAVKSNDVKIEVEWCGICGSDLHEYVAGPMSYKNTPLTFGHEFSGKIIEIGENVTKVKVGDRVTVEPIISCGTCSNCKKGYYNLCVNRQGYGVSIDGAFAEYIVVQENTVHILPDNLEYDIAALAEPTAVALHAVRKSQLKVGDACAVFGAGPIGLLAIQAARAAGASKIIAVEVSNERRGKALELGATHAINPAEANAVEVIQSITDGGVDVAFDAAGVEPTFLSGISSIKPDGELMIISLWEKPVTFNPNMMVVAEKKINTSLGYRHNFREVLDLLANGTIDGKAVITKKIMLDEIVEEGFEVLTKDRSQCKILVKIK